MDVNVLGNFWKLIWLIGEDEKSTRVLMPLEVFV